MNLQLITKDFKKTPQRLNQLRFSNYNNCKRYTSVGSCFPEFSMGKSLVLTMPYVLLNY